MLLPVSFAAANQPLTDAITEHRPVLVVSTGLWPGEPVIRLERVAVNRASFEMPDNDGQRLLDDQVEPEWAGGASRNATRRKDHLLIAREGHPGPDIGHGRHVPVQHHFVSRSRQL